MPAAVAKTRSKDAAPKRSHQLSQGITNPARGEGQVYLGGKQRKLRFEMDQLCELEEALGDQNVAVMIHEKRFSNRVMTEALAIGMRPFNKSITVQQVRLWLKDIMDDPQAYAKLMMTTQSAIMCSMSGPKAHAQIQKQWTEGAVDEVIDSINAKGDDEDGDDDEGSDDAANEGIRVLSDGGPLE